MLKLVIPSLLFFIFLKSATEDFGFSWKSAAALILIVVGSSFLNSPPKRRLLPIIILTLVAASHLIFLFVLKDDNLNFFCLGLSSFIFLSALFGVNIFFGRTKEIAKFPNLGFNLIKSAVLISVFLWAVGSYGLYLYLELPTHFLMLIILAGIILSAYCLLKINPALQKPSPLVWFYSFLLGFIMVELVWVISFWPIGRFTVGAVALANYYIFYNILENRLKNSLDKKIIFFNILFLAVISALLLFSSQWEIR